MIILQQTVIQLGRGSETTYTTSVSLEAGDTKTISIFLIADERDTNSGKLKNTASVTIGSSLITTRDYVKVYPEKGTINKYISSIGDRKDYTGTKKLKNPVEVGEDVIVIFTIVVKNNSRWNTTWTITDSWQTSMFELYDATGWDGEESNIRTKTLNFLPNESKTIEISLKIKSGASINTAKYNKASVVINGKTKSSKDYAIISPNITIDKNITRIDLPESTTMSDGNTVSGTATTEYYNRSGKSIETKYSAPVNTLSGTIVYYSISVTSDVKCTVTLYDTYDTTGLEPYATSGWSEDTSGYTRKVTVDSSGCTVELELKVKSVSSSTTSIYENKIEVKETEDYDCDYVYVYYNVNTVPEKNCSSGTYKKYISDINGVAVQGRNGYTNIISADNPETVKNGDVVTYTLEVQNTSDVDIVEIYLKDTPEEGLELSSNSSVTIKNIGAYETKQTTITATVTKSDMFLYTLKNTVSVTGGIENTKFKITYYITTTNGNTLSYEYSYYENQPINVNNYTTDSNEDYVQLDDVEFAGYVWEDTNGDGVKDSTEQGISGIPVFLHSSRNNFLVNPEGYQINYENPTWYCYTITDDNGYYSFEGVKKGDSDYQGGTRKYSNNSGYVEYYLTYDYCGVYYESTIYTDLTDVTDSGPTNNWQNKSHASEEIEGQNNRKNFNKKFLTISYNKSFDTENNSGNQYSLSYDKDGHISTFVSSEVTKITSSTPRLFKYNSSSRDFNSIIKDSSYLKYINLGLIPREQADLELTKDVVSADVEVNGFETTYTYESLGSGDYIGSYKLSNPYKLLIYAEDYNYRTSSYSNNAISNIKGTDNDLKVNLTYKITITNSSLESTYYTSIKEVIDFYTNEMILNRVYDENGNNYYFSSQSEFNNVADYSYNGYNTVFINDSRLDNIVLAQNESLDIYLDYSVMKSNNAIIIDSESDLGKVNIAQIGAFSVYTESDNQYVAAGVVDQDSNPGNLRSREYEITDDSIYEDDTYYTAIQILLRDDTDETTTTTTVTDVPYSYRQISGNVWEDLNSESNSLGQEFGDGTRNSREAGAKNIVVKLMEVVSNGDDEYLVDTGVWTTTDDDGDYTLENSGNLHAGTYIVRFIYGDNSDTLITEDGNTIKYSGQDYKSTLYTDIGENGEIEIVEASAFSEARDEYGEISTAKDNELRRLEVISYSTTMTYYLDSILKSNTITDDEGVTTQIGNMEELAENTGMYADSKKFNIQIEYNDYYTDFINRIFNGLIFREYHVEEVNFGLVERPITKLELLNDMVEMIATTSDGKELIHLYFDTIYYKDGDEIKHESLLDGTKSVGNGNVQILNRSSNSQGFRYVNVDSELLQGMVVTVKYKIAVANTSDIDTSNQNLIDMVKNYDVENVAEYMKSQTLFANNEVYRYGNADNSGVSDNMLSSYSYTELLKATEELANSDYQEYTTSPEYNIGYFLGNIYYSIDYTKGENIDVSDEKIVETRVDQIVNYVDNDIIFRHEDNVNENGVSKFINYTVSEISEKNLLAGITPESEISDGNERYITEEKNNLIFNIESEEINPELYKFLAPITDYTTVEVTITNENSSGDEITRNLDIIPEDNLYMINVTGTRTLSSEADAEGLSIDNLSEIVKITNTVGRKVYISSNIVNTTGYIGNTTLSIGDIENPDAEVSITTVAGESDTDYAEYTTFSPPTGYTEAERQTQTIVKIVIIIISILAVAIITIIIVKKVNFGKKIYK